MSRFGLRMALVGKRLIDEFGDSLAYTPMAEVVNGKPVADDARTGGSVKAILTVPGVVLGGGWQLANSMHVRTDENPMLCFIANGLLASVQKFDEVFLAAGASSFIAGPRRFQVADGPEPIGFGWFKAKLFELTLIDADEDA